MLPRQVAAGRAGGGALAHVARRRLDRLRPHPPRPPRRPPLRQGAGRRSVPPVHDF